MWYGYYVNITRLRDLLTSSEFDKFAQRLITQQIFHPSTKIVVISVPLQIPINLVTRLYEFFRYVLGRGTHLVITPSIDPTEMCEQSSDGSVCSSSCSYCHKSQSSISRFYCSRWIRAIHPAVWREVMESQVNSMVCAVVDEEVIFGDSVSGVEQNPVKVVGVSRSACLGGSFDGIHEGHLSLLFSALQSLTYSPFHKVELSIGITPDSVALHKDELSLHIGYSFNTRYDIVTAVMQNFLNDLKYYVDSSLSMFVKAGSATIQLTVNLLDKDGIGFSGCDPKLDTLIVSSETFAGADRVNQARLARGLRSLRVVCIPVVCGSFQIKTEQKRIEAKVSNSLVRREFNKRVDKDQMVVALMKLKDQVTKSHYRDITRSLILEYINDQGEVDYSIDDMKTVNELQTLYRYMLSTVHNDR